MSQQVNLYFEESTERGDSLSAANVLRWTGLLLLGMALIYGYEFYQSSRLQSQIQEVTGNLASEQKRLDKLAADYSSQRSGMTLEQELKNAADEVKAQKVIIDALRNGVIGNTAGFSGYMEAFARQAINGLWLTGFSIEGNGMQMSISGATVRPDLVPGYIMRLNREDILRGRNFESLQMQLPQEEAGKAAQKNYIDFTLQSVAAEGGEQ